MMTPVEVLKAAKARIADPSHWTQNSLAKNAIGVPCSPHMPDAVSFCALGVLDALSPKNLINEAEGFLILAAEGLPGERVTQINDEFGHTAVLTMYDKAIELAEAAHE